MGYGAIYFDIVDQGFIDRIILAAFKAKLFTINKYRWFYNKDTHELDSFVMNAAGNWFVVYPLSKISNIRVRRRKRSQMVYVRISEPNRKDSE